MKINIDIINKINDALKRMEDKGHIYKINGVNYYEELKRKRGLILQGYEYEVKDVTPYLIAEIGSLIPCVNKNTKNKIIKCKTLTKEKLHKNVDEFLKELNNKGEIKCI